MKKLLIFFIISAFFAKAQNNTKTDSLLSIINSEQHDSLKAKAFFAIISDYKNTNLDSALKYANMFLKLAEKTKNNEYFSNSFHLIGDIYRRKNENEKALEYAEKSEKYAVKITSKPNLLIVVYNLKANIYYGMDRYNDAIELYQKAIDESYTKKSFQNIHMNFSNLGIIYFRQGKFSEALNQNFEALKIIDSLDLKVKKGSLYGSIGVIYQNIKEYDKAYPYFDKAIESDSIYGDNMGVITWKINYAITLENEGKYKEAETLYLICLESAEKYGFLYLQANIKCNLGNLYYRMKDIAKASQYFKEAYDFSSKIGANNLIVFSIMMLGEMYTEYNDKENALKYLNIAKQKSYEMGAMQLKMDVHKALSIYYEKFNNPINALEEFKIYISFKDSILNENKIDEARKLELRYEFDKQKIENDKENEKKLAIAAEAHKRQRLISIVSVLGLILVILFLIILYNRFKVTQKQKEIITIKEQETQKQKLLVEEKNHEITQSIQYAQKIQSALLPNEEIFRNSLKNSFILFNPKDIVSGDFYWLSDRDDYIFYATADSTGHGVPGGFMSMLGTALLNEIIDERKIANCGEVLTLMREKIMQALKQTGDSESKDGMDMVLIRIDKKTLEMQYAAANNSLYIVSNMQSAIGKENCVLQTENCLLFELPCDKMPVGVYHSEVKPFQTFTHQLQKGDTIYTYTDGYADQFGGEKGKKYTYKRLREKLVAISNEPLEVQKRILVEEFESWKSGEQIDDVCLIGVKI